jgi:hypothetical protein
VAHNLFVQHTPPSSSNPFAGVGRRGLDGFDDLDLNTNVFFTDLLGLSPTAHICQDNVVRDAGGRRGMGRGVGGRGGRSGGGHAPGRPPIPSSAMPYRAPHLIGGRDDEYGSSNWNEDNKDTGGDDLTKFEFIRGLRRSKAQLKNKWESL